jgi:hypothetical protein
MNRLHWLLIALCAASSGCSVARPIDSEAYLSLQDELSRARAMEKTDPRKAAAFYEGRLSREIAFDRPFLMYQERLVDGLEVASKGGAAHQAILPEGVSTIYDKRVSAVVDAKLGLARVQSALGDRARAERHALGAARIAQARLNSPASRARKSLEAYQFLEGFYGPADQGSRAGEARLQVRLLRDYLESPRGKEDQKALDEMRKGDGRFIADANSMILQANAARAQQTMSQMVSVAQAAAVTVAAQKQQQAYQRQYQAGQISFGEALMNSMIIEIQARNRIQGILENPSVFPDIQVFISAGKASIGQVQQLSDSGFGKNTPSIYRDYLKEVGKGSSDNSLVSGVNGAFTLLDAVDDARNADDPEKAVAAAGKFLKAFLELQRLVK